MNTAGGGQTRLANGSTGPPNNHIAPAVHNTQQSQQLSNGQPHSTSPLPYGDDLNSENKPEQDAVKMFVGQVPKNYSENELKDIFAEFGDIFQINVLRDKQTNISKGCCFVTYFNREAAVKAQAALHNNRTLPGMNHPLQMKPANKEKRGPIEERKLFVGMLSKKMTEDEVEQMFSKFGTVEECSVIRDENKISKGYAFVTFSSKQGALTAIQQLNGSRVDGSPASLVVRIADSQREKDYRRQMQTQQAVNAAAVAQQQQLNSLQPGQPTIGSHVAQPPHAPIGSMNAPGGAGGWPSMLAPAPVTSAANASPAMASYMISLLQQAAQSGNLGVLGNMSLQQFISAVSATGPGNAGLVAQLLTSIVNQQSVSGASSPQGPNDGFGSGETLQSIQNLNALTSLANSVNGGNGAAGSGNRLPSGHPGANSIPGLSLGPEGYSYTQSPGYGSATPGIFGMPPNGGPGPQNAMGQGGPLGASLGGHPHGSTSSGDSPAGKKTSGPDGCNLFIYHLPPEYTDHDLAVLFSSFGNLVSAKVFIDKQTNLSKCFGFVSYDNPQSAQSAIVHMNGYSIGQKRLKVQQKRPKGPNDISPGSSGGNSAGNGPSGNGQTNAVTHGTPMSAGLMAVAVKQQAQQQQQVAAAMVAAVAQQQQY